MSLDVVSLNRLHPCFLNVESFQEAYDVYGALDIVANNAGIISHDNRRTIEVNLVIALNMYYKEPCKVKEKMAYVLVILLQKDKVMFISCCYRCVYCLMVRGEM